MRKFDTYMTAVYESSNCYPRMKVLYESGVFSNFNLHQEYLSSSHQVQVIDRSVYTSPEVVLSVKGHVDAPSQIM